MDEVLDNGLVKVAQEKKVWLDELNVYMTIVVVEDIKNQIKQTTHLLNIFTP